MKKYRNNTYTWSNLHNALSGEALSHMKYVILGDEAEKNGYPEIANCYRTAAHNELTHGRMWMEELGMTNSINEGLQDAAYNENMAETNYRKFAADAENEGHEELRNRFLAAADVEKNHTHCFSDHLERFLRGDMYTSSDCNAKWRCYNCGHLHTGNNPPERCPLCGRPETWFVLDDN